MKWRIAMIPHTRTGRFSNSIDVERANDKDYWVVANVPYAFAVEYGHHGFVPAGGFVTTGLNSRYEHMRYIGWVEGIHVLRRLL